jgi:hypothetical protein
MNPQERTYIIRTNRVGMLNSLLTIYPGSLDGQALFRSMLGAFPDYTRNLCVKDLYYLESKGYVVRKNPLTGKVDTETHWGEARWALTAAGNEVANRLSHDEALEL